MQGRIPELCTAAPENGRASLYTINAATPPWRGFAEQIALPRPGTRLSFPQETEGSVRQGACLRYAQSGKREKGEKCKQLGKSLPFLA
jgi:hypothetical protein